MPGSRISMYRRATLSTVVYVDATMTRWWPLAWCFAICARSAMSAPVSTAAHASTTCGLACNVGASYKRQQRRHQDLRHLRELGHQLLPSLVAVLVLHPRKRNLELFRVAAHAFVHGVHIDRVDAVARVVVLTRRQTDAGGRRGRAAAVLISPSSTSAAPPPPPRRQRPRHHRPWSHSRCRCRRRRHRRRRPWCRRCHRRQRRRRRRRRRRAAGASPSPVALIEICGTATWRGSCTG